MWRGLSRLELGAPVPQREFELLRNCPVFEPLPLATVEGLARRLVPVEVDEGTEVITQGEAGDRFYLIAEGAVDVYENDVFRRRQGGVSPLARSPCCAMSHARRPYERPSRPIFWR